MSDERLTTDPAGDVIHPRIQYLEEWIRDCQRHNRAMGAQLAKVEDEVRDLRSLVALKNEELRQLRQPLGYLEG